MAEAELGGDDGVGRGERRGRLERSQGWAESVDGRECGNRGQKQEEHTDPRPDQHRMDPADMTGTSNVCKPHSENSVCLRTLLFSLAAPLAPLLGQQGSARSSRE